jgi:hypothetical protein
MESPVGPAGEHRADEAFGFADGLWVAGAGAGVTDPEGAAGDGVDGGSVGRSVVGDEVLDGDAVSSVERDGASQEPGFCGGFLVGQDFGVGEPGRVVDRDVDGFPAADVAAAAVGVGSGRVAVAAVSAGDPFAGAAFDAAGAS